MIAIRTRTLGILSAAIIFAGIAGSAVSGFWKTTSTKEPATIKTGELAGRPDPADIRGSYTWQDIENSFGVPAKEAAAAFSTDANRFAPTDKVNALETAYAGTLPAGLEIGTGSVRLFVALYAGLPLEAEDGTVLPDAAVALLADRPGMDAEALGRFRIPSPAASVQTPKAVAPAPAVPADPTKPVDTAAPASPSTTAAHSTPARTIVGKTTYGDLFDWGLSPAQVEQTTGFKAGPRAQSVKDAAGAAGVEFSAFKAALQALVDKATP